MCATTRHAPRRTPRVVSLSPASLPPPPPPQARPNPNICLSDVRLKQTSQPKSPKWRSPARFLRPNTVFAAAAARYTFLRVSLSLSLSLALSLPFKASSFVRSCGESCCSLRRRRRCYCNTYSAIHPIIHKVFKKGGFGYSPRLVGRYCSYLLPKQALATSRNF